MLYDPDNKETQTKRAAPSTVALERLRTDDLPMHAAITQLAEAMAKKYEILKDTPGFDDTEVLQKVLKQMVTAVSNKDMGVDCIDRAVVIALYALTVARRTEEEKARVQGEQGIYRRVKFGTKVPRVYYQRRYGNDG